MIGSRKHHELKRRVFRMKPRSHAIRSLRYAPFPVVIVR